MNKISNLATLAVLGDRAARLQKKIDNFGPEEEPSDYTKDVAAVMGAGQNPFSYGHVVRKTAELCMKIAGGAGATLSSVTGSPRSVGAFAGNISNKMMRPPGLDTMRVAMNPRRNLRQAMTAFTA